MIQCRGIHGMNDVPVVVKWPHGVCIGLCSLQKISVMHNGSLLSLRKLLTTLVMFDVSNETHFYDQLKVLLFPLPIAIFCSLIAVFLHTSYL